VLAVLAERSIPCPVESGPALLSRHEPGNRDEATFALLPLSSKQPISTAKSGAEKVQERPRAHEPNAPVLSKVEQI
jgi:hypothetical protein